MTDAEEQAYEQGRKRAWLTILQQAIRELGAEGIERAGWISERAETVQALRDLCDSFGDNDWPDDLHLADVLNKHVRWYAG